MIYEEKYWTVYHEGGWTTLKQNGRPYVVSTWIRFVGKFRTKAEAKEREKQIREVPTNKGDKIFVVEIDQRKALADFDTEWVKPDHGKFGFPR